MTDLQPGKKFNVDALYWDRPVEAAVELVGVAYQGRADGSVIPSQRNPGRTATQVADSRGRSCASRTPLRRRLQQQSTERGSDSRQAVEIAGSGHSRMGSQLEGGGRSRSAAQVGRRIRSESQGGKGQKELALLRKRPRGEQDLQAVQAQRTPARRRRRRKRKRKTRKRREKASHGRWKERRS